MRPFALEVGAGDFALAAGHLRMVISLLFGTRSAGTAERKGTGRHFIRYKQRPFSSVTSSHSLSARAHSRYDIAHTGRFREDGRIIEGRRQIVRGVSRQHNERLVGLAQFPRDRLACLAAEVDVENGDIAIRLKPERFSYRRCRPLDLVTGRSKLLADLKAKNTLVLYYKYASTHDFASPTIWDGPKIISIPVCSWSFGLTSFNDAPRSFFSYLDISAGSHASRASEMRDAVF
jgi:hypothetical protein